jgi:sugar lactone lactonase YvrE
MTNNKKRIIRALVIVLLLLAAVFVLLSVLQNNTLNNPESIAWDEGGKRFLISNAGNGQIMSMDDKGGIDLFLGGLGKPRGLKVTGDILYATDDTKLQVIDIKKAKVTSTIPITGAKMLNDIETDHLGRIYMTDTQAAKLFIYDPGTKKLEGIAMQYITAPNGIVYDGPRRQMFIVGMQKASPIVAFNVETREFSIFQTTLYDDLDGIAIDDLGRIYFSSWGDQCVFMIPQEQNRTLIWQSGIASPADIFYNKGSNEILVPDFEQNKILRFKAD